jgi:predicted nuclease of predicted toxin-antitoxin system
MKYLADENVARRIVDWLRSPRNDVRYAADEQAGDMDADWLRRAEAEGRLLVTSDKDFGEMIFRDSLNSHGVILLRLEKLPMAARLKRLEAAWSVVLANPAGCFIVITQKRVRVRPLSA